MSLTATTELELRLLAALRRIASYQTPEKLRRCSQKQYGLPPEEAIEYAYENVLAEAAAAIKGVRQRMKGTPR